MSCPSASQCVAVDNLGNEVTYAPTATPAPAVTSVDGTTVLNAVSCPAGTGSCGAVDNHSQAVGFTTTGSGATPHAIVAPALTGVSCPSRTQCTAVTHESEVTFDPTSGTINGAGVQIVDPTGNPLTGISCVSTSECTAIDTGGNEVTFVPANGNHIAGGSLSLESAALSAVTCQEVSGAAQCTAVDTSGNEVTFNPETSSINANTPALEDPSGALQSVACPSAIQCTAVDNSGNEVTFNPVGRVPNNYTTQQAVPVDSSPGNDLLSVACPSTTQCTAVDQGGYVVTFTSPAGPSAPTGVVPQRLETTTTNTSLDAIACPSTAQCTTVDSTGHEATFNPTSTPLDAALLVPLAGANALHLGRLPVDLDLRLGRRRGQRLLRHPAAGRCHPAGHLGHRSGEPDADRGQRDVGQQPNRLRVSVEGLHLAH